MSKLKKGYRWFSVTRENIYGSVLNDHRGGKKFHLNSKLPFDNVEEAIAALEIFNRYHRVEKEAEFSLLTVYYWED